MRGASRNCLSRFVVEVARDDGIMPEGVAEDGEALACCLARIWSVVSSETERIGASHFWRQASEKPQA